MPSKIASTGLLMSKTSKTIVPPSNVAPTAFYALIVDLPPSHVVQWLQNFNTTHLTLHNYVGLADYATLHKPITLQRYVWSLRVIRSVTIHYRLVYNRFCGSFCISGGFLSFFLHFCHFFYIFLEKSETNRRFTPVIHLKKYLTKYLTKGVSFGIMVIGGEPCLIGSPPSPNIELEAERDKKCLIVTTGEHGTGRGKKCWLT